MGSTLAAYDDDSDEIQTIKSGELLELSALKRAGNTPYDEKRYADILSIWEPGVACVTRKALMTTVAPETFQFELHTNLDWAQLALAEDPNLKDIQYALVPNRIRESEFWRTYFYIVLSTVVGTDEEKGRATEEKEAEYPLLSIRECFMYRVPPMRDSRGYSCKSWGLESPMRTCSLKPTIRGDVVTLKFYDQSSGELFLATKPFALLVETEATIAAKHIVPVIDSSRYFVVRGWNERTGQEISVGIGFRDRSTAFDLTVSISEQQRMLTRTSTISDNNDDDNDDDDGGGGDDDDDTFALHDGERISISLKGVASSTTTTEHCAHTSTNAVALPLAPPPPPSTKSPISVTATKKKTKKKKKKSTKTAHTTVASDDWGDFTSTAPTAAAAPADIDESWGDFE